MKQLKFYFFALNIVILSVLFFTTCCKEEEPYLSVSPAKLTFKADDTEEKTAIIDTDAKSWQINSVSENWVDASQKTDNKLYVRVQNYSTVSGPRTATITIGVGKNTTAVVTIEQEAKIITLSANPGTLSYTANETGDKTVNVETNADNWEAAKPEAADWISLTKQAQTLVVNVTSANPQITTRTADITITAEHVSPVTVTVTQGGATPTLTVSPPTVEFTASEVTKKDVTVTTNATGWDHSEPPAWLELTKSGNTLSIRPVSPNSTDGNRTATIQVTATGTSLERTVTVTQKPETLSINPASLEFLYDETNSKNVTVTTSASSWNYSTPPSWLTLTKSGNTLQVRPSSQYESTSSDRTASIEITAGSAKPVTLTVTQFRRRTLSVSPGSITFTATETTNNKQFTVNTNADFWHISTLPPSWLYFNLSDNAMTVRPTTQNTSTEDRYVDIVFYATGAPDVTVRVTQYGATPPQPIHTSRNYTATAIVLENNPPFNNTSWTGQINPGNNASPPWIGIRSWGGSNGPTVYCDYVNGRYKLDNKTVVALDHNGIYEGYAVMATYNSSNGWYTPYPNVDYYANYNPTTGVLDFSGTYNGMPTCIMILAKNKNTGQWVYTNTSITYYVNIYRNLRLTVAPSSSAPLKNGENAESSVNTKAGPVKMEEITITKKQ